MLNGDNIRCIDKEMAVKLCRGAIVLLALTLSLIGCSSAPKAIEVTSAYVPASRYSNLTCDQLFSEAEAVRRSVPALSRAVDEHRSQQIGVEVVTWLLFWPAALALDKGETNASQLATAKGELEAIALVIQSKKCEM